MCLYVNRPLGRNYQPLSFSEVKFFNCLFNFATILPLSLFLSERRAIRFWSFKILISLVIIICSFHILCMVGVEGLEPPTSSSQATRSTNWPIPRNLVGVGGLKPPTLCVSDRYSNQLSYTPIYSRRIKITYQFPKQMLIYKLLEPSLCMVDHIAAGVPASFESLLLFGTNYIASGAGERTWTSRTRLLRPLPMPFGYTRIFGAIDETRTRDLVLTKNALYQLSYDSLCTDFRQS